MIKIAWITLFWLALLMPAQAEEVTPSTHKPQDRGVPQSLPERGCPSPDPHTVVELLEKLLKVMELPNGHVTKQQVESIFGVTLTLDEEYLKKFDERLYSYKTQHVHIDYEAKSEVESLFMFEWGQISDQHPIPFSPPPRGMCMDANKFMSGIVQRGWVLKHESRVLRDIPYENVYRKDTMGILRMAFSPKDNCVLNLSISATNFAEQLVR